MTPELAQQLLNRGIPKTGSEAEATLKAWLRNSPDKTPDRYGNFLWTALDKAGEERKYRFHFQAQVLNKQVLNTRGGSWSNLSSTLFLDSALGLLAHAAKVVNDGMAAAAVEKAQARRVEKQHDRASKKESAEMRAAATTWAWKRIAWEAWEDFRKLALEMGMDASQKELDRLQEAREVLEDEYLERAMTSDRQPVEADGSTPAGGDPVFASASKPPVLPFIHSRFKYIWAEASGRDQDALTVRVEQGEQHRPGPGEREVIIRLGAPPGGLEVNARGRVTHTWTSGLLGAPRQYLVGTVNTWNGPDGSAPLIGQIVSAPEREGPEAEDVWLLWEKILRGYRVPRYRILQRGGSPWITP